MGTFSHVTLVAKAVSEMKQRGVARICAAHISGYTQPSAIGGYIPDATGTHNGKPVIVEVETAEGLLAFHAKQQLQAFVGKARSSGGTVILATEQSAVASGRRLIATVASRRDFIPVWGF